MIEVRTCGRVIHTRVSSMVLTKMKETAEAYLGTKVIDAVVTVPAHFKRFSAPCKEGCKVSLVSEFVRNLVRTDNASAGVRIGQERRWRTERADLRYKWRLLTFLSCRSRMACSK